MIRINSDDIGKFQTLYSSGKTLAEISSETGFSISVIRTRLIGIGAYTKGRRPEKLYHCRQRERFYPVVKQMAGQPVDAIARKAGTSATIIRSCMVDLGIPMPETSAIRQAVSTANSNAAKLRRKPFLEKVRELFDSGYPVNRIAKQLSVGRPFVNSCLSDLGTQLPTIGEGISRSAALASPDERRARAAAAHQAIRATGISTVTLREHAREHQSSKTYVGIGETEVAEKLRERGIDCIPQAAFDEYNIDILCGNLAVEVHVHTTNPLAATQRFRRTVKLLSAGYSVFYIWIRGKESISISVIDQLVAFYDIASSNPSPVGQYRVVRGDGEIYTRANAELDDIAGIVASYCALKS